MVSKNIWSVTIYYEQQYMVSYNMQSATINIQYKYMVSNKYTDSYKFTIYDEHSVTIYMVSNNIWSVTIYGQ